MLKKINEKWIIDIRPAGKHGIRLKRTFKTKTDALQFETWAKNEYKEVKDWEKAKKDNRKLSEIINLWWEIHGKNLRAGKDTYKRLINLSNEMGNPFIEQLSAEHFLKYRAKAKKSDNTLNRELAYLKAVINSLIANELIKINNPLIKIKKIKIKEVELSFLTDQQIVKLLNTLKESKSRHIELIAKICLSTGARWSEAQDLNLSQLQGNKIQFARTKSGKVRAVDISDKLKKAITDHAQEKNKIFEYCYKSLLRALKKSEIELPAGQASHVLRHTFASHYLKNGGDILKLKTILGHQNITTTMRYAHLINDSLEASTKNPLEVVKKW